MNSIKLDLYECECCNGTFYAPVALTESIQTTCPHCNEDVILTERGKDPLSIEAQKVFNTVSKNLPNRVSQQYNEKYSILTLYYGPVLVKDQLTAEDIMKSIGVKPCKINYISDTGRRQVYNMRPRHPSISEIHCVIEKDSQSKYWYMIHVKFRSTK